MPKYFTLNNIFTVVIPVIITILGFYLNSRNTGKQIEKYKRKLDSRSESLKKVNVVYERLNVLVDYISEGYLNENHIIDSLEDIRDSYKMNNLFIPEDINKDISHLIDLIDDYYENIVYVIELKKLSSGIENVTADNQRKKIGDLYKKRDNMPSSIAKSFIELRDLIRKKYDLFY
ncbi:hypothetical protein [Companilactobacillus hulinensis]|uniref:hypothetical protein n=1 Tax=Companilactobacillus hulinensis TaxID=2486007 RepID=UPI000F78D55A|nr:hypothetical protein [Companilactobacillus hulinensis]